MRYAIPIACVILSFIAGWMARGVLDLNAVNHTMHNTEQDRGMNTPDVPRSAVVPNEEFRVPREPPGGYAPLPSGGINDLR